MPKRSKNSTDGAVFTYHERRRMDHGSSHRRLPGAALKEWDRCALGLAPPTDPVLTPDGVLYDREAILRDLLRQREEARREKERAAAERVREERARQQERTTREKEAALRFEWAQGDVFPAIGGEDVEKNEDADEKRVDPNFWLPAARAKPVVSAQNGSKRVSGKGKMSLKTRCPISKKALRSKDLISLRLTPNKVGKEGRSGAGEDGAIGPGTGKFMCPVCQIALTNAVKPVALRTGTVLCSRCVAQFVMKDKTDPCSLDAIDVKTDIIPIFNVGTAFAASAADDPASREATVYRPSVR